MGFLIYFSQAYCNILAGASMVIGLKFAGTANQSAFETLVSTLCDDISLYLFQRNFFLQYFFLMQ